MKEYSHKSYKYSNFFEHYFKHDLRNPVGNTPEQILIKYKPLLPTYVNTVVNFGCSNGRDFIPFQENYKCIGFDLAPLAYIEWVCATDNLTYNQCSIEDYLDNFDHSTLDLTTALVYTQGTLMYIPSDTQDKFIQHLLDQGCKNMIFHEYPPEYTGPHTKFNPSPRYLNLFEQTFFRPSLTGFVHLDR